MQKSYRKQLIELAKLYGIVEIKNYLKSSRRVTNGQIELLLIKNNVRLPKKSLARYGFKKNYLNQIYYTLAAALIIVGFFGGAPNMMNLIKEIDFDKYNSKTTKKQKDSSIDEILKKKDVLLPENEKEIVYKGENKTSNYENTVRLNSSTISILFEETKYDLSEIRKNKKVKPIFISLLPSDIQSIEGSKKKKRIIY